METPAADTLILGHAAAVCMARAVARGVFAARSEPGDVFPAYAALHGGA
jgi:D-aminopeptidase